MKITSKILTGSDIRDIVRRVSDDDYAGNITIDMNAVSTNSYRVKLGTNDSKAHGSRTSASGRHGKYLSWQGFRDVLAEVFLADPNARVYTGRESYLGAADFMEKFPDTAYANVGSEWYPAYLIEMSVDGDATIHSPRTERLAEKVAEIGSIRTIGEVVRV
jgi:hypothetical protein